MPANCSTDRIVSNGSLPRSSSASIINAETTTISHVVGVCRTCARSAELVRLREEIKRQKFKNGVYLSIILGNSIDLSLRSSKERYEFKNDYEKFKLRVTRVVLIVVVFTLFFPSRPADAVCNFLLVWYYCTLTIRESVLRINGSRIQAWWVAHHYIACILCGIALTWPDDSCYREFRSQFLIFAGCIALVQQAQYRYQSGCLRRLTSLGESDEMDLTLEGFASWMFRGLTFLLPFLFIVYAFEFYNSYALCQLWAKYNCEGSWQVPALAVTFFILGLGNTITVVLVIVNKLQESAGDGDGLYRQLKSKYPSMNKLHRR